MKLRSDTYDDLEAHGILSGRITRDIIESLKYPLRDYQTRALERFIYFFKKDPHKLNNHVLFEMATGSGKTLLMAALMLYLYKQGYRHFVFFVNSTTILEKTKVNFIDTQASKYLFADEMTLSHQTVAINPIENFDEAEAHDLNIMFTTIQGLHTVLNNPKENSVTFEDLQNYKIVLLADEAHHLNAQTKKQHELDLSASWEDTVKKLFAQNDDNVLIELTATAEIDKTDIADKYYDKLLYRYSLAQFCRDGFSKNIAMIVNRSDIEQRMVLGMLASQFRQEIADSYNLFIKPVILFKSDKIETSKHNQKQFVQLLENLTKARLEQMMTQIKQGSEQSPLIDAVLRFFQDKDYDIGRLVDRLQRNFSPQTIINVNEESEKEKHQLLLNSLEDKDNSIRVIFAVNKLNEGWDVLNLFDIVKLFRTQSQGKTTQEAQLIGRGARYCPFHDPENKDNSMQRRKYDLQADHLLRFCETLHYHTMDETAFIHELNRQLAIKGLLIESRLQEMPLNLKPEFRQSDTYKNGYIFVNNRLHRQNELKKHLQTGSSKNLFQELTLRLPADTDLNVEISIHHKTEEKTLNENQALRAFHKVNRQIIKDIGFTIFYKAVSKNPFYRFDKIGLLLGLKSMRDLYEKLGNVAVTFIYDTRQIGEPSAHDRLRGVMQVLDKLEQALVANEYQGSEFEAKRIDKIFTNKKLVIAKDIQPYDGKSAKYFAQDSFHGTSEEIALVECVNGFLQKQPDIQNAWLLRNAQHFTLYRFEDGKGFQPDFVLFLQKNDVLLTYQLFIEPKGKHLHAFDGWKEEFMKAVNEKYAQPIELLKLDAAPQQKIIGLPFYHSEQETAFIRELKSQLHTDRQTVN